MNNREPILQNPRFTELSGLERVYIVELTNALASNDSFFAAYRELSDALFIARHPSPLWRRPIYLDWVNNFLTVDVFAEHYGISIELAGRIIVEGRNHE